MITTARPTLRVIPGGRSKGDGRQSVDLYRNDTGEVRSVAWTLPELLADIRRRSAAGPNWTFRVGPRRHSLAISMDKPGLFYAQREVADERGRFTGAALASGLNLPDVERILRTFYEGLSPERCLDGCETTFERFDKHTADKTGP
jgi:hypothetical protein